MLPKLEDRASCRIVPPWQLGVQQLAAASLVQQHGSQPVGDEIKVRPGPQDRRGHLNRLSPSLQQEEGLQEWSGRICWLWAFLVHAANGEDRACSIWKRPL